MDKHDLAQYAADIAKEITIAYCGQKELYLAKEDGKNAAEFYNELFDAILTKLSATALLD